ncbi:MAG TPA: hypothetical protein V6C81_04855 [Planktothrix sp.]
MDTLIELLQRSIDAHGGLDRWREYRQVTANFLTGGGLLALKGSQALASPVPLTSTVTIDPPTTVIYAFGNKDWRLSYRPDRVAIETSSGEIVEERSNPRDAFKSHTLNTPWNRLDRGYFSGYARWTYLTTPWLLTMPGFEVEEIAPWKEGTEKWRGLRARFPANCPSHSQKQEFYFGDDFLLRRHDYVLEIGGNVPVTQYVSEIVEADGFRFPTKRRAYMRAPDLQPIRDLLLISIDISDLRVEK